jgi:hypothetical protein
MYLDLEAKLEKDKTEELRLLMISYRLTDPL